MITFLFFMFFGTGSMNESAYYTNHYMREKKEQLFFRWLPLTMIADALLILNICIYGRFGTNV